MEVFAKRKEGTSSPTSGMLLSKRDLANHAVLLASPAKKQRIDVNDNGTIDKGGKDNSTSPQLPTIPAANFYGGLVDPVWRRKLKRLQLPST